MSLDTKQSFYADLSQYVTLITQDEYNQIAPPESESPETIAWLAYEYHPQQGLQQPEIFLNTDRFNVPGIPTNLIPLMMQIVIRHEVAELWHTLTPDNVSKPRHQGNPGQAEPHYLALQEEWQLAYELGCPDTYMRCIEHWTQQIAASYGEPIAQQFLWENQQAATRVEQQLKQPA